VLKRLKPDSIAGRTTGLLIVGALLIIGGAGVIADLTRDGDDLPRPFRQMVTKVETIVALTAAQPPDARAAMLRRFRDPELSAQWSPAAPPAGRAGDWFSRRFAATLARRLAPLGVGEVRLVAAPGTGPPPGHRLDLRLGDGSWLSFRAPHPPDFGRRWLHLIAVTALVGAGIVGLAIFVARWVSRPLRDFATAATRLGEDVEAPPMAERGPGEIRSSARAFNQMQRRIRAFVQDRMHMLAAASHDLRTPITRLRLRADFVDDSDQRAKMLADLNEMEAIIASVIAFVREDTNPEPKAEVDLVDLVRAIAEDQRAQGRQVQVTAPGSLALAAPPVALKRALANLIENACLYGGRAEVTLKDGPGEIRIEIADTGPGIPEAEQENVFKPFYRLEKSRSRETGGTGLGLALARLVIRNLGGDIALRNRPGGGLSQTVTLARNRG